MRFLNCIKSFTSAVVFFSTVGCQGFDSCGNDKIAEIPSPDQNNKVVIFQRDCGATTGFSTQASLVPANSTFTNDGGNLFAADTDHGRAPAAERGGPELRVIWKDSKNLVLQYHSATRIFLKEKKLLGISVTYETFQ